MKAAIIVILLAFGAIACGDATAPGPHGALSIAVAPLSLEGVADARYTLTVTNAGAGGGDVVWSRTLTSSRFGDGAGSLSYVGPCDASTGTNSVLLTVDALFAPGGAEIDASTYQNPTTAGPLTQAFVCREDADVAVSFDITIARRAQQGFFDIAMSIDDLFCSAKFDCQLPGGGPIELLFNASGQRDDTAVLAFACTGGAGSDTHLYLSDLDVDCAGVHTSIDPSLGPGRLSLVAGSGIPTARIFDALVTRGEEALGDYHKLYWNTAIGLTDVAGCTLAATGTVSDGPLVNQTTPVGATWPLVQWDVAFDTCTRHALGGADDVVSIQYSGLAGEPFAHVYSAATLTLTGALTAADPGRWSDGTLAPSCEQYRRPLDSAYQYTSQAGGDGVYRIEPPGEAAQLVYCDMTTDDGGWTAFFAGTNGQANTFDHFDSAVYAGICTDPASECLRHIPTGVAITDLEVLLTADTRAVKFPITSRTYNYFVNGTQDNWLPLVATDVGTTATTYVPDAIWSGESTNYGWIAARDYAQATTFASSFGTAGWDYVDGTPNATARIRMLYRTRPAAAPATLNTVAQAATSCRAILDAGQSQGSGVYHLSDGAGGTYLAHCDMVTDGGGWTVMFAGVNGSPNVFDRFDYGYYAGICTDPSTRCLRRMPSSIPQSGTTIAAAVGADVVDLGMNAQVYAWATAGTRANWVSLSGVTVLSGAPGVVPDALWTGQTTLAANTSFIVSLYNDMAHVFMSSYDLGDVWDFANGVPDTTSPIRLMYREGGIPPYPGAYASCKAALAAGVTDDGVQPIQVPGTHMRLSWCDQTHEGGGWTALYSGKNGSAEVFDYYDAVSYAGVCTDPATRCLRRPAAALDPATTELAVSCGDAMVAFDLSANIHTWLSTGQQLSWQPLTDVRSIGDTPAVNLPTELWTGLSGVSNRSWILGTNSSFSTTFANSYSLGTVWDYCNSGPNTGQTVRIFYRSTLP